MDDNRSGKDRREKVDRRKGGDSSHHGPENRGIRYRRSDKDRREINNNSFMKRTLSLGNEGRRFGIDQREFSYAGIMPERRSGKDRRSFVYRPTK
jgi:hypothetical protein